jgi:ElaA protein
VTGDGVTSGLPEGVTVVELRGTELEAPTLYDLLRLRAEVFVVEQACAYLDLDGRDLEPGTRHLLANGPDGALLAAVRVLDDGGAARLGRVVTAAAARGSGLASALIRRALDTTGNPVVLSAQAHLADWYATFGFEVDGPDFDEDGIPHRPMRLEAAREAGETGDLRPW